MVQSLRHAIRALWQSPIVSTVAAVSLALAIGANTAVFSIVNALLLRPLPVASPERLVTVSSGYALRHGFKAGAGMNYEIWSRMRERIGAFDGGFAWAPGRVDLADRGEMQPAQALFASGHFFGTLGVRPLLGRAFSDADDVRGGGADGLVTVIGHRLWQQRYAGRPDAIGSVLAVDGVPVTVIGVMPADFFGIEVGEAFDLAIPLAAEPALRGNRPSLHHPRSFMLTVMLRLKPGQEREAAASQLRALQPSILGEQGTPEVLRDPYVLVPAATGTADRSALRRRYTRPLVTMFAVVVLVLLVACVNIANLLLARATARRHEIAVRLALGASRWQVGRQLLVESVVLSAVGAVIGLVLAVWASRGIVAALSTPGTPISLDLPLDVRVLGLTALTSLATAIVFGLAPAWRAGRVRPAEVLTQAGRGGARRTHVAGSLVVLQVALSLTLLVAAGLLVSTFTRLASVPLGFDSDRLLVVEVETARAQLGDQAPTAYAERLADTLSSTPGVAAAAASSITPFSAATRAPLFAEPGRVHTHAVSPGFFAAYGMPLRAGRAFDGTDSAGAPGVAVVSETYARRFLAGGPAIGRTIDSRSGCGTRTGNCQVVGVVSDAVFGSARDGAHPTVYVPLAQSAGAGPPGRTSVTLSVRAGTGPPARLAPQVAAALARMDSALGFTQRRLQDDVDAALTQERLAARLAGFFGGLALLLSSGGLYGITAYSVSRRRVDMAVRLALGATRGRVIRGVLAWIGVLVGAGLAAGMGLSLWAGRFIAALLYGVQPYDLGVLAGSAGALAAVAAVSAWLPAFRGSRLDPAEALRQG